MAQFADYGLEEGDDFLPLFLRETEEYSPWIQPQSVDLMNSSWEGGPIEVIFVDAANTWDLTNRMLRVFGPHLAPERSRVVLPHFRYHYAHCLPLIFDSRPGIWRQVEDVESGYTVTFMPLKPLFGPSGIDLKYSEESFPLPSADQILRSRMARESSMNARRFRLTLYRKYAIEASRDAVEQMRTELLADGFEESELRMA